MKNRVVVTGLGSVTPLGIDARSTWQNLINGKSGIGCISSFDAERFATQIAGEIQEFYPEKILDGKLARRLDRFTQLACVASLEAVEHAKLDMAALNPARVVCLIGSGVGGIITIAQQQHMLTSRGASKVSPFTAPMMLADMASSRVSIMLGAEGANFSVTSACASGADSIGQAAQMIRTGEADVAIAGGAEAPICGIIVAAFNACMALSKRNSEPQKASRPFDMERDGFVIAEGSGILVLESLDHAEKRGVSPIVELAGYGASSDAYHITQPDPQGAGGVRAMKAALEDAGMLPIDISYINAHGTSTPLNDKMETVAMKKVFGDIAHKIPISSTKSMTGHLLGAAGGVEAVFSAMAVSESVVPPTINLEEPDPNCDLNYVPNLAMRGRVSVAMSNSMGFGGHNSSLIFREIGP